MDQDLYELPKTQAEIAEAILQMALVDFRTMKPETQKAFMIAVLDEYVGQAKEGPFDQYFAGQMLTRVQLIASFINARPQPGLKVVSNVR